MAQHQSGADIAFGTHGAEPVGGGGAPFARGTRAAAARRPDPGRRARLADPGFIPGSSPGQALEPHLDRLAGGTLRQRRAHKRGEVCFELILGGLIRLRVMGACRDVAEPQMVQDLAHRALVVGRREALFDDSLEVDPPPANHAVR